MIDYFIEDRHRKWPLPFENWIKGRVQGRGRKWEQDSDKRKNKELWTKTEWKTKIYQKIP